MTKAAVEADPKAAPVDQQPEEGFVSASEPGVRAQVTFFPAHATTSAEAFFNVTTLADWFALPPDLGARLAKGGHVALYGVRIMDELDANNLTVKDALAAVTKVLSEHPKWRLRIESHVAKGGSDTGDSENFVKALIAGGIATSRLQAASMGDKKPIVLGDADGAAMRNVRFELVKDPSNFKSSQLVAMKAVAAPVADPSPPVSAHTTDAAFYCSDYNYQKKKRVSSCTPTLAECEKLNAFSKTHGFEVLSDCAPFASASCYLNAVSGWGGHVTEDACEFMQRLTYDKFAAHNHESPKDPWVLPTACKGYEAFPK